MDPPQKKNLAISVGKKLVNAIGKLQGNRGVSIRDLKKYFKNSKKMDIADLDGTIKLALTRAIDTGILTREDGSYKLKEARRRRSRSRSRSRRRSSGRRRKRSSSPKTRRAKRKRSGVKRRSSEKRRSRRRRRKSPATEEQI